MFILHVLHEHGEKWWNDIDRGKLHIFQPELSSNPTSGNLVANQEEVAKKMFISPYAVPISYSERFFNMS
jgi:hypothetical protein